MSVAPKESTPSWPTPPEGGWSADDLDRLHDVFAYDDHIRLGAILAVDVDGELADNLKIRGGQGLQLPFEEAHSA